MRQDHEAETLAPIHCPLVVWFSMLPSRAGLGSQGNGLLRGEESDSWELGQAKGVSTLAASSSRKIDLSLWLEIYESSGTALAACWVIVNVGTSRLCLLTVVFACQLANVPSSSEISTGVCRVSCHPEWGCV